MKTTKQEKQKGVALLVVLLVMVVVLTLGLGAISQSVTDIKISQEEEESARAFNLAEAGLEEALRGLGSGDSFNWTDTATGDEYTASIAEGGADGFVSAKPVKQGDVIQLVVSGDEGHFNIYWQDNAAIEVIILENVSGSYELSRLALDSDAGRGNNFDTPDPDGGGALAGMDYDHTHTIDIANDYPKAELVRIRPLYADSYIGVNGDNIDNQYYEITATGKTESGVTRKIELTRDIHPSLPSIFDYAVFSGTTITK